MSRIKLGIVTAAVLVSAGIAVLLAVVHFQTTVAMTVIRPPAAIVTTPNKADEISGQPVELIIPALNYDLKVIPGYYDKQTRSWTLTTTDVEYATITPPPNNVGGDTFMYGHDVRKIFASLHTIPNGAVAIVKTANNHTFYYQLAQEKITDSNDDSVFNYSGKPILTLQTCEGLFYQNRQFFIFNLIRVA